MKRKTNLKKYIIISLLILLSVLFSVFLCGCDDGEASKVVYSDKIVEVEKPIYIDREVIVEKPTEIIKTIEVEVPVEKIVEVEKIIEKEIPVEIEKIITQTVTIEVPVEKVVEVEKVIEKEIPVERYNSYYEDMFSALTNAVYCNDRTYKIGEEGWTTPYLAVWCQGESGSNNPVIGYHSTGCPESEFYRMKGYISKVSGTQICAIKRSDNGNYEDYLPKPLFDDGSNIYAPSTKYAHTLGTNFGLHVLTNVKVECISDNTAAGYSSDGLKIIRTVISYDNDYCFGDFYGGILEDIRLQNRKIKFEDYRLDSVDSDQLTIGSIITIQNWYDRDENGIYYKLGKNSGRKMYLDMTSIPNTNLGYYAFTDSCKGKTFVTIKVAQNNTLKIEDVETYFELGSYNSNVGHTGVYVFGSK